LGNDPLPVALMNLAVELNIDGVERQLRKDVQEAHQGVVAIQVPEAAVQMQLLGLMIHAHHNLVEWQHCIVMAAAPW